MTTPKRIQLSRAKGWRKPDGAIVVARPTRWGNPFRVYRCTCCNCWDVIDENGVTYLIDHAYARAHRSEMSDGKREATRKAVALFADLYDTLQERSGDDERAALAGHDLACWCPLDQPCHADVLLEIANDAPDGAE